MFPSGNWASRFIEWWLIKTATVKNRDDTSRGIRGCRRKCLRKQWEWSGIFWHVDALPNAGDDDQMMRFISTAAKEGEAACKVARQFVSGIITFRVFAMPRAPAHARIINQIHAIWPPRGKAGIRIFQFIEETSRELLIGRGWCSMLLRRYTLPRIHDDETGASTISS